MSDETSRKRRWGEIEPLKMTISQDGKDRQPSSLKDFVTLHDNVHRELLKEIARKPPLVWIEEAARDRHFFFIKFFTSLQEVNTLFLEMKKCKEICEETVRVAESVLSRRLANELHIVSEVVVDEVNETVRVETYLGDELDKLRRAL